MAIIPGFDESHRPEIDAWIASRPEPVRSLALRLPPDRLYRIKATGQIVTIEAYGDDGTIRVTVSPRFNLVVMAYDVFGLAPDDLEECDMPPPEQTMFGTIPNPDPLWYDRTIGKYNAG